MLLGSTDAPDVVRADGTAGSAAEGAFMSPILVGFADASAEAVHEIEAFGPVASVMTYSTIAEAAELVARGGGSLVTSVATDDPDVAVELLDPDRRVQRTRAVPQPR